jgi:hypothetical protein
MREFRIIMSNRPGELARVATALSRQEVSIKALAASASGNHVTLHLIGHDVEATRTALRSASFQFEEHEVLMLLLEDRAGEIARIANQLADVGVNLQAIYIAGRADDMIEVVIAPDDMKKAKKLLGDEAM